MKNRDEQIKQITSVDVAKLAGVSRSAVSRTFTPGASVAPKTREKVLKAAEQLGYRVNQLARSLTNKRSDLVGIVAANMDNPFRAQQVEHIARTLMDRNFRPILLPAEGREDPSRVIGMLLEYNVSGVIVTSDTPPQTICQECVSLGVPVILVNKRDIDAPVDRVLMDNAKCGAIAAKALHERGCMKVAYIGTDNPSYSLGARRDAFKQSCTDLGMEPVEEFSGAFQDYEGGATAATALLRSGKTFDGIFCATDYVTLGVLDCLRLRRGPSIPEHLQVIGCDDIRQASWIGYDLTTIRQDTEKLATAVVDALQNRFSNPNLPATTHVLDVELILRGTTRPL